MTHFMSPLFIRFVYQVNGFHIGDTEGACMRNAKPTDPVENKSAIQGLK